MTGHPKGLASRSEFLRVGQATVVVAVRTPCARITGDQFVDRKFWGAVSLKGRSHLSRRSTILGSSASQRESVAALRGVEEAALSKSRSGSMTFAAATTSGNQGR